MLNMTTFLLSQTKKSTDWLQLERIMEMQVGDRLIYTAFILASRIGVRIFSC